MLRLLILKDKTKIGQVSLVPNDVKKLVSSGIKISVEKNAGAICGFSNLEYSEAGATIINKIKDLKGFDLIASFNSIKNNKLISNLNPNQLYWSFLYPVNNPNTLQTCMQNKVSSVAIETINLDGDYDYLSHLEEIKGSNAALVAAYHLTKHNKKSVGKYFRKVSSTEKGVEFLIINYSYAGYYAAKTALAIGADVTYLENSLESRKEISSSKELIQLASINNCILKVKDASFEQLNKSIKGVDVVILTNELSTEKTPCVLNHEMIKSIANGGIYINLARETGDGSLTESKNSTLSRPIRNIFGVNHYLFENIGLLYPNATSSCVSSINVKYFTLFNKYSSIHEAIKAEKIISNSLLTYRGELVNKKVGNSLLVKSVSINELLK